MAIASKGKGKSGGARVITYNVQQTESDVTITLMSIYDKSEISNVSDTYLRQLVKEIESEISHPRVPTARHHIADVNNPTLSLKAQCGVSASPSPSRATGTLPFVISFTVT